MSLDRIDRDPRKPSVLNRIHTLSAEQKSQEAEPQQLTETEPENYSSALDRMSDELLLLSQQNLMDAETKYRLTLIIATVREQNAILASFLKDTKEQMEKMNSNQLRLISEQEQYEKSVRDNVSKSVFDIYSRFKAEQTKAFAEVTAELKKTLTEMKTQIDESVKTCEEEAENLRKAFRTSKTLSDWIDAFYFLAPTSIIIYVIFKIVTFFMQ